MGDILKQIVFKQLNDERECACLIQAEDKFLTQKAFSCVYYDLLENNIGISGKKFFTISFSFIGSVSVITMHVFFKIAALLLNY